MPTMTYGDTTVTVNDEGFLLDPNEWTRDLAEAIAREEGIDELTDRHWAVIDFCRKDFASRGETPGLRRISKESGVGTKELYELFPKGPAKKVSRIAGLGKPQGCV
jgi:tRNA 2-thiouridine synthesizing protein E